MLAAPDMVGASWWQVGESGWSQPLPLESSNSGNQEEDVNTRPVLLRAHIPDWGTVHEVVARVEMAGSGFEHTMVSTQQSSSC